MKPAIELHELGAESLICESDLTTKTGAASSDYPVEIKELMDVTDEEVLGLPELLKLW